MDKSLNRQGIGLLLGLAVQYMLGMAINLFVEFPAENDPHTQWNFAIRNPLVVAHLILGTLLVLSAIAMITRAMRQGITIWKLPAALGLAWVVVAWAAGDAFVATQSNILSYLMSLTFVLAMLSYAFGLYRGRNNTPGK